MKKRTAFIGAILSFASIIFFTGNVKSEEYICSSELSAFGRPGEVESGKYQRIGNYFVQTSKNGKFKLPHIGWNQINIVKDSKIFKGIENNSHMYFVHSYEFVPEDKNLISATTEYSSNIVCSVEKENIFGTQFHPEKSDKIGLKIINNFIKL